MNRTSQQILLHNAAKFIVACWLMDDKTIINMSQYHIHDDDILPAKMPMPIWLVLAIREFSVYQIECEMIDLRLVDPMPPAFHNLKIRVGKRIAQKILREFSMQE